MLTDRGVIEVHGPDAERFLHDLVTNSIGPADLRRAIYAGLLSPQGKIQFDFIVHAGDGRYLLDVVRDRSAALMQRLTLYKLRAKVTLVDRSNALAVGGVPVGTAAALPDPRHSGMPWRCIVNGSAQQITDAGGGTFATAANYDARRIALGVPEGGKDYGWGELFTHEALYDQINGVDFSKGCFVGQEIVSRMQHRGTARSRFTQVIGATELPPLGTPVLAGDQPLGVMGSHSGAEGLALIRLDRLQQALSDGKSVTTDGIAVTLRKPEFATYAVAGGA